VQVSMQKLLFENKECVVVNLRDVSQIQENTQLHSDNRMLQIYNSSISHEMLTPIKCLVEVSKKVAREVESKRTLEDLSLISNTAKLLLNQVKGNLDRSLLAQNLFEAAPEKYSVYSLVQETTDMLSAYSKAQGVFLAVKGFAQKQDVVVAIDKMRTQQILINLIQNAVKFSDKRSSVILALEQYWVEA
jgi:signal transduction histidine kinase